MNGLRNESGSIQYSNGNRFIGSFNAGRVEGKGEYLYQDGRKFTGSFKNGIRQGYGVFQYHDQTTYLGNYSDGVRVDSGVKEYSNDPNLKEFNDDQPNGTGIFVDSLGNQYTLAYSEKTGMEPLTSSKAELS